MSEQEDRGRTRPGATTATRPGGGAHSAGARPPGRGRGETGPGGGGAQLADREIVYRLESESEVSGARRASFDVAATIAGALAALGTLVLLGSVIGAAGELGYQSGVEGREVTVGALVAGLGVLLLAGLVGGWVAGRAARRRGGAHGLVAALWLLLLAAVLAALAEVLGDDLDVQDQVGLPDWFSEDAMGTEALLTGLLGLALLLLGGWAGGRWAESRRRAAPVSVIEHRHAVREHPGGIVRRRAGR